MGAPDRVKELEARLMARGAVVVAAHRLLPSAGYLTDDMPDDEQVNLVTTVGALRQLQKAMKGIQ